MAWPTGHIKLNTPRVYPRSMQTSSRRTGDASVCPSIFLVSAACGLAGSSLLFSLAPSFPSCPSPSIAKPRSSPWVLHRCLVSTALFGARLIAKFPMSVEARAPGRFCHLPGGQGWEGEELALEHRSSDAESKFGPIQTAYVRVAKMYHLGKR